MHFLNTMGMSRAQLDQLIESALRFKSGDDRSKPLAGKSVALVFFNPSLRTRASMQVGIYELGGNAVVLEPGGTSWTLEHREGAVMDADKAEHVAEFVRAAEAPCRVLGPIRCPSRTQSFVAGVLVTASAALIASSSRD